MESDGVPGLQSGRPEAGRAGHWKTVLQADLPLGQVELIDYDLGAPLRYRMSPQDSIVELLLTERHVDRLAWLPQLPGAQEMGDIVLYITGQVVEIDWPATGPLRAVRCSFRHDLSPPRSFSPEERLAALNVRSPVIRNAMHELSEELLSPGFQSPLLMSSLAGQIAVELGRYFRQRNRILPGRLKTAQLRLVDERIEAGGNLPTAAEMAQRCGLSKRHFFRLFRLTTGMSLADYASRRRIERAKALLRQEDMVVKQVAYHCGFQTPSAFSAAFRRVAGMTPREYRLKAVGQG